MDDKPPGESSYATWQMTICCKQSFVRISLAGHCWPPAASDKMMSSALALGMKSGLCPVALGLPGLETSGLEVSIVKDGV